MYILLKMIFTNSYYLKKNIKKHLFVRLLFYNVSRSILKKYTFPPKNMRTYFSFSLSSPHSHNIQLKGCEKVFFTYTRIFYTTISSSTPSLLLLLSARSCSDSAYI